MNKITMVRNIKEKHHKKDTNERESNWNNRFNVIDKSPLTKNLYTEIPTVIKPTNLRQTSSKLKIKTETTHIRIKSANKTSISSKTLPSTPHNVRINSTTNNLLLKDLIYLQIKSLWEVLGVTMNYRLIFDDIAIQLNTSYREGFLGQELCQLQKLQELIQSLKKDITVREKIIEILKKFDKHITINPDMQGKPLPDNILNDIINTIRDLRVATIKIIKQFVKIRKNITYDVVSQKIDLDKVKDYNSHYMITIKNDTDFLALSSLAMYFTFAQESDPFLTFLSNNKESKNNQDQNNAIGQTYTVQIDEDLVEPIKECQYIFMQEMIHCENKKRYGTLEPSFSVSSLKMSKKMNTSHNEIIAKKRDLKQIRMITRSPDFKKLNQSSYKEHIIAGKMTPLKYEDSKIGTEKKFGDKKYYGHSNYIGKNQGKDCIETKDLMAIDAIIYRSTHPKKEENVSKDISASKHNHNSSISSNPNAIDNWKTNDNDPILITEDTKHAKDLLQEMNESQVQQKNEANLNIDLSKQFHENNLMNYNNKNEEDEYKPQLTRSNRRNSTKGKNESDNNISKDTLIDIKEGKEYDGYTFTYFTESIEQLREIYSLYLPKINEEQIIAFNLSSIIDSYFIGVFPKIIIVKTNKNEFEGIITFSYDSTSQSTLKLNITSLSTIDNDKLKDVLLAFIKYSNEAIIYDEMHIEFYYAIKDGQFILNKNIEDIIKSKAKFKWVNMENDGKIRKINYKLLNPKLLISKDSLANPSINKDMISNVLKIKSCSLISIEKTEDKSEDYFDVPFMKGENEVNDFVLMCLFSEMKTRYDYTVILPILKDLKNEKLRKLTNDFVKIEIGAGTEIVDFIQNNLYSLYTKMSSAMLNEYFLCTSLMKVDNSFDNIVSTPIDDIVYNKLELPSIEVFSLKNDNIDSGKAENEQFYLIHSTNENCSLLIYEIIPNGAFSNLLDNETNETKISESRIFQTFKDVYYKIDQQPNDTKKTIYIPSFTINKNHFLIKPKSFENMSIQNEDSEYVLSKLNQYESITFGGDNNKGMITFPIKPDDLIIKSDFIIAIINPDLLCDLQIPTIAAYIVKKDKWTKIPQV